MSTDSTTPVAARIAAGSVTSRVSGVTRWSECIQVPRVLAYTRRAPRRSASSTSARPMPLLPPVTRTVFPVIFVMMTIPFSHSALAGPLQ